MFMSVEGMIINIKSDSNCIASSDLTKTRFLAACHRYLHTKKTESEDYPSMAASPLLSKLVFDDESPLYLYKLLMGCGFQLQGDLFSSPADKINIYQGWLVQDYLSMLHPNHEYHQIAADKTFMQFLKSEHAYKGGTLIAAARNLGDSSLESIKTENQVKTLFEKAEQLKFA